MRILIVVASRYGATREIAEELAQHLRMRGYMVDTVSPNHGTSVVGYDAVIVGSAVYFGRWRKSARRFVAANSSQLRTRPVWLFSSGPVDDAAEALPASVSQQLVTAAGAIGHQTFRGRLDYTHVTPLERAIVRITKADAGDYRDWAEVERWANSIADALAPTAATS